MTKKRETGCKTVSEKRQASKRQFWHEANHYEMVAFCAMQNGIAESLPTSFTNRSLGLVGKLEYNSLKTVTEIETIRYRTERSLNVLVISQQEKMSSSMTNQ